MAMIQDDSSLRLAPFGDVSDQTAQHRTEQGCRSGQIQRVEDWFARNFWDTGVVSQGKASGPDLPHLVKKDMMIMVDLGRQGR